MELIDKLFAYLTTLYGKRWTVQFDRWLTEETAKKQWQSALQGLTTDEIRSVLVCLKQAAKHPTAQPPHFIEFYRYAKRISKPYVNYDLPKVEKGDPQVARASLDAIKSKLKYRKSA